MTKERLDEFDPNALQNFKVLSPLNDSMDRGNHELTEHVVINLHYYDDKLPSRGDIVYFQDQFVSRIVALPGEKIRIVKGQIYIDGAKLDTFYGSAHFRGYNYRDFVKSDMKEPAKTTIINEVFKKDQDEILLGSDEVYLVSDDWMRSSPEVSYRGLPIKGISGRVVGTCSNCTS
jgi:signal peptidase I